MTMPQPRRHSIGLIAALVAALAASPSAPAAAATTTLYDGALGGTPNTQGAFLYLTHSASPPLAASQSFANGATTLTTTLKISDQAGYFDFSLPQADRAAGFAVRFTAQVLEEDHSGSDDRAGFSVIVLDKDHQGIELGFWEDQVWAQSGPQFTRAETTTLDTTTALIDYTLIVQGNNYTL